MSHPPRPAPSLPPHFRPSSGLAHHSHSSSASQQSALQARIHEKKRELDHLRQLRDLSAGLAGQMQQLEDKLATLSNGTEAVAAVLSNWHSVLRAVYMAGAKISTARNEDDEGVRKLPQTLVRIPIHQVDAVTRADAASSVD